MLLDFLVKILLNFLISLFKRKLFSKVFPFDFLDLDINHSERDLEKGLLNNVQKFLLEMGNQFSFIGSQFKKDEFGFAYFGINTFTGISLSHDVKNVIKITMTVNSIL